RCRDFGGSFRRWRRSGRRNRWRLGSARRKLLLEPLDQLGWPNMAAGLGDIVGTARVGKRLFNFALQFVGECAVLISCAVGQNLLGIKPDRVAKVGDRAVGFAFGQMAFAAQEKGERVRRLVLDRFSEVRDRALELLFLDEDVGAPIVSLSQAV